MSIRHRPASLRTWRLGALLLVGLLLGLVGAGCGGDDGDGGDEPNAERSAAEAAKSQQQPSQAQLARFLMRDDEEPGFRQGAGPGQMPRARETITGVEAFVEADGLSQVDARRLRREGFISITFQPIRGPRTAGVTNVALFATAEGAERNLTHEARAPRGLEDVRHFTVRGVPGARGWTASIPGEPASHDVGNVFWVQGRCVLVLGNQGPGPFVGPLSTGARAIYERTNGQCP